MQKLQQISLGVKRLSKLFGKRKTTESADSFLLALEPGFIVSLDDKNWTVLKIFEYSWGNKLSTYKFLIGCDIELIYLSVENNKGKLHLTVEQAIDLAFLNANILESITTIEVPPPIIMYDGKQFKFDRESIGRCHLEGDETWTNVISWDYFDKENQSVLYVEKWGNDEIIVSQGKIIKPNNFTLIEAI